jgi:hypothetical protein
MIKQAHICVPKITDLKVRDAVIRDAVFREANMDSQKKDGYRSDISDRFEGVPSDGRITFRKASGHLRTVLHHKYLVAQGCFQVGLYYQGVMHDLSKFSPEEILNGFRYYQGGKQSPNNGERVMKGYSAAWMHHKGRNRHHFEYWTDYSIEAARKGEPALHPVQMPRRYVAEMLMDRIAASKTYMKENYTDASPLEYYRRGKAGTRMHPQTAKELELMLKILAKKGERRCFHFVKNYYLRGGEI